LPKPTRLPHCPLHQASLTRSNDVHRGLDVKRRITGGATIEDIDKTILKQPPAPSYNRVAVRRSHEFFGIMLEGRNMRVIQNVLGNAMSDSVEILTGPGEIRGNYFEITGTTHVAAGSDRGNSIIMAENIVHVKNGGSLDIGFRSWADSQRHIIANNILTVDPGGQCACAIDIRGFGTAVTGNVMHTSNPKKPLTLRVSSGNTLISNNIFENVVIEVEDKTELNQPIIIQGNILENSRVELKKGNLVTAHGKS
jgi:hypothetical protein